MKPERRRARLQDGRLYVVSGPREERGDLTEFLDAILGAGVDVIQLREKEAEPRHVMRWSETFREAAERHDALFVLNDRPDIAMAVGADGVHLGQNDVPVDVARRILGEHGIIGVSTRTPEQYSAVSADADYVCAGPVWETPTKPGRPAAGLEPVRYVAARERRPWFAIGGVAEANVAEVVASGASRIVVVRAVTEADDPGVAVKALLDALP
ncbi:MAG TPA: thiamine phosphate synthase [Actinomycetota bacterium]|nr:thiamine phosphate synthase [Actinomycetota bacterium]